MTDFFEKIREFERFGHDVVFNFLEIKDIYQKCYEEIYVFLSQKRQIYSGFYFDKFKIPNFLQRKQKIQLERRARRSSEWNPSSANLHASLPRDRQSVKSFLSKGAG